MLRRLQRISTKISLREAATQSAVMDNAEIDQSESTSEFKHAPSQIDQYKQPRAANYAKPNQPFPMNPYYQPVPPLSDKTRSHIYSLYLENPIEWTPRRLAEHFGISIIRVEAVLRLKALEQKLGGAQHDLQGFTQGMEQMLASVTIEPSKKARREDLREYIVKPNPFMQLIDEEQKVTPQDAASLLKMEPFENVQQRLDKNASQVFDMGESKDMQEILSSDSRLKGKCDFVFVDSNGGVTVRDSEGNFRLGTKREVYKLKSKSRKMSV